MGVFFFSSCTAWCIELGSLASLDAPEFHASSDAKEAFSLHQAVVALSFSSKFVKNIALQPGRSESFKAEDETFCVIWNVPIHTGCNFLDGSPLVMITTLERKSPRTKTSSPT